MFDGSVRDSTPVLLFRRNCVSPAKEYERNPFPSRRCKKHSPDKPPHQLAVSKIVKALSGKRALDHSRSVDPSAHPSVRGTSVWIGDEHEKVAGVDTDVHVSNSANRLDKRAIICTDIRMPHRECLEVEIWGLIRRCKHVIRKEMQTWTMEAGGHYAYITFHQNLSSRSAFWHTLVSVIEDDTFLSKPSDVATQHFHLACANLIKDVVVDHRGLAVQANVGRSEVFKIAVEELLKEGFRDPSKARLLSEDV